MQPDGSYLCFGNSECNKETTLSNPTIEVNILILVFNFYLFYSFLQIHLRSDLFLIFLYNFETMNKNIYTNY